MKLTIVKNPCYRYRWPKGSSCETSPKYSGAHGCEYDAGHDGPCKCGSCGLLGHGFDQARLGPKSPFRDHTTAAPEKP